MKDPLDKTSTNIKLALISIFFIAISSGLFFSGVFSVFVVTLGGDNASLGFLSSFGGVVLILSLIPGGLLVDRINRSYILKIGLLSNVLGYILLLLSNDMTYLYISQIFINLGNGFVSPALQSLIADSIRTNNREKTYAELYLVENLGNSIGPLFAVITFIVIGDNWDLSTLKEVFYVAFIFLIIGALIQSRMNERHSFGNESESNSLVKTFKNNKYQNGTNLTGMWYFVPLFIIFLGFIIAIGAGLSVSYFAIFFKDVYNQLPTTVNFLFFLSSVVTALIGYLAPKLAQLVGKIEAITLLQLFATLMFFLIALIPPFEFVAIFFLFRGAFMNAGTPIKNGVVMDLVPKRMRGKMSSLDSLTFSLVFALSAGIGGVVLDEFNFQVLFLTTTAIYIIGTLPLLFLRPFVSNNKKIYQQPITD